MNKNKTTSAILAIALSLLLSASGAFASTATNVGCNFATCRNISTLDINDLIDINNYADIDPLTDITSNSGYNRANSNLGQGVTSDPSIQTGTNGAEVELDTFLNETVLSQYGVLVIDDTFKNDSINSAVALNRSVVDIEEIANIVNDGDLDEEHVASLESGYNEAIGNVATTVEIGTGGNLYEFEGSSFMNYVEQDDENSSVDVTVSGTNTGINASNATNRWNIEKDNTLTITNNAVVDKAFDLYLNSGDNNASNNLGGEGSSVSIATGGNTVDIEDEIETNTTVLASKSAEVDFNFLNSSVANGSVAQNVLDIDINDTTSLVNSSEIEAEYVSSVDSGNNIANGNVTDDVSITTGNNVTKVSAEITANSTQD